MSASQVDIQTMSKSAFTKSLFSLLLALLMPTVFSQQQPADLNFNIGDIPENVRVVIDGHNLPESSFSLLVQEVGEGVPLLAHNIDTPFNPASSIKTLTTLAALDTLGPAFTWKTELYALGPINNKVLEGDLLMKGSGDPFLVEDQLRNMLKALQRNGIEHVTGNLVLDGSYFDPIVEQSETIDNQNGRAYNTEPNAVISNFQSVSFYFKPHPNGRDVVILTDPQLPNLKITNRLRLVNRSCSGYQRGISFNRNGNDSAEVIFEGQFPSHCTQYRMVREVLNAPSYTFGLFTQLWGELGGQLDGSLSVGKVPDDLQPVLTWNSLPMSDMVKSINKFSNNLMTRQLLLTLGAEIYGSPATLEKGIKAIESYLEIKGMDTSQLNMSNGAGLSRNVRITTALLNEILRSAWLSPYMPEYLASLPINGMDGTMRNRLRGTNISGRMHIKTGSLDEVSAIAGFVYSSSNKTYAVTGIINHELAARGPGTELMNALLTWVYQQ